MKPLSVNQLSVLLAGTLLLCHGVFGVLHLVCSPPRCAVVAEHTTGHEPVAGGAADAHEHPMGHGAGTEYFAVVAGLLTLLLGLFPGVATSRVGIGMGWPPVLRRAPLEFRSARDPTLPTLQVFRL
jgi:hypothetical protein